METTLAVVTVIDAIILIVAVVVFFITAKNIAKIKDLLAPDEFGGWFDKAKEELAIGNVDKAKEYLLRAKYVNSQQKYSERRLELFKVLKDLGMESDIKQ